MNDKPSPCGECRLFFRDGAGCYGHCRAALPKSMDRPTHLRRMHELDSVACAAFERQWRSEAEA